MQMPLPLPLPLYALFFFLLLSPPSSSSATASPPNHQDLVRSSCLHARYPHLCLRTLSSYAGPAINTPNDLAQAALEVSLDHARRLSHFLNTHASSLTASTGGAVGKSRRRQEAALSDCVEQISDSVEDLSKSLTELQHLRTDTFQWQMSNAQTWVSAAMTDDDTCLDGLTFNVKFNGGKLKRKINRVARVTSNALYMINRLCDSRSHSRPSD